MLGLAVTAGCLWWAVADMLQDENALPQIGRAFREADYRSLAVIWGLLFAFYWLKAWRWRMLLAPLGDYATMRRLFPPLLIGFAFNNLLPAHLGEFVRVYVFARDQKLPRTAVLSSVVLERVFDLVAILALLAIGLVFTPGIDDMDPRVRESAVAVAILVTAIIAVAAVYVIWTGPFVAAAERCLRWIPGLPASLRTRIAGILETGAEGLAALKDVRLLAGIALTSLVQWMLNGVVMWISLRSFGIDVPLLACGILLGVVGFAVAVPASPGYFGVIQLCFMTVLKLFVDDDETVFAASVYYHLAQYVPVTLLGLYYFNRSGLRMADVEQQAEETADLAAAELEAVGEAPSIDRVPNP